MIVNHKIIIVFGECPAWERKTGQNDFITIIHKYLTNIEPAWGVWKTGG